MTWARNLINCFIQVGHVDQFLHPYGPDWHLSLSMLTKLMFPLLWLLTLLSLFLEFLADLAFLGHSSCSYSVSFMYFSMSWSISNRPAWIRRAQTMPEYSRTEFRVRQSKYHAIGNQMQAEPWWCQSPEYNKRRSWVRQSPQYARVKNITLGQNLEYGGVL